MITHTRTLDPTRLAFVTALGAALTNVSVRNVWSWLRENAATKEAPKPNWGLLGVMRFVLAMAVVINHCNILNGYGYLSEWASGTFAVIAFLLISGYSIAHSLEAQREGYFVRRVWRIYPVYISAIVLAIICGGWKLGAMPWIACLFMLQGIIIHTPNLITPAWSLGGEWWCYILGRFINVKSASILLVAFCVIAVGDILWSHTKVSAYIGAAIPFLGCAWLSGYLLFHGRRWAILPVVPLTCAVCFQSGAFTIGMAIGWIWIIVTAWIMLTSPKIKINVGKLAGDVSYPLYLVHFSILASLGNRLGLFAALIISMFIAIAVHIVIERPILALRSKCKTNRAGNTEIVNILRAAGAK
jgi:peptidoglycan/LPS O-acetylase OafA/YrhL